MTEIKPCPFCYCEAQLIEPGLEHFKDMPNIYINCVNVSDCNFSGPSRYTVKEAIESWNSIQVGNSSENVDDRRFQAACAAMQSLIALGIKDNEQRIAMYAITQADALLKSLEKK